MSKKSVAEIPADETPRRRDTVGGMTGAEMRIRGAIDKVTALGDDPLIMKALDHLHAAFEAVGDFVDGRKA